MVCARVLARAAAKLSGLVLSVDVSACLCVGGVFDARYLGKYAI